MTNKLPVVGKRYKIKHYETLYPEVEVLAITNSYAVYLGKDKHGFDAVGYCGKLVFLQDYEELPKDKAETKPTIKENLQAELSPEVEEAMEELRRELEYPCIYSQDMKEKSQNLLNALDKQFNLPQENTNLGEECCSFGEDLGNNKLESLENKESIWKPVSELPKLDPTAFCCYVKLENDSQYINAKYFAGEFYTQIFHPDMSLEKFRTTKISKEAIKSFCTLTDFINDYEKLKKIVKELEKCLRK